MTSDIRYENQDWNPRPRTKRVDFADRLVRWGVAKDRRQAEYILLGIAILAVCIAFFAGRHLVSGRPSNSSSTLGPPPLSSQDVAQPQ